MTEKNKVRKTFNLSADNAEWLDEQKLLNKSAFADAAIREKRARTEVVEK
jgi:hypothetical protein